MLNSMKHHQKEQDLSRSLEIDPLLIPYAAEILADITALGSWPEVMVKMLEPLGLPPETSTVMDLGCGKGAASIRIAQKLEFQVFGIDLFPPFIQEARERAAMLHVESFCTFDTQDIRSLLRKRKKDHYDVVIYAALGGLLGTFSQIVGRIRTLVPDGRYMIIDDGFLAHAERMHRPGYEYCRNYEKTRSELTRHGDVIVSETIIPKEDLVSTFRKDFTYIRWRIEALSLRHPELMEALSTYLAQQQEEYRILEQETVQAVWLLQKNAAPPS